MHQQRTGPDTTLTLTIALLLGASSQEAKHIMPLHPHTTSKLNADTLGQPLHPRSKRNTDVPATARVLVHTHTCTNAHHAHTVD